MEDSILTSTKLILGISADETHFDLDICTHINSALSSINQLGVGPDGGFSISDSSKSWSDFLDDQKMLNLARQYVYLKVRKVFDPPASSWHADASDRQLQELEFRMNLYREVALDGS